MAATATGKPELAEESLRQVVKTNPNHAYAHHSLGKVRLEAGKSKRPKSTPARPSLWFPISRLRPGRHRIVGTGR